MGSKDKWKSESAEGFSWLANESFSIRKKKMYSWVLSAYNDI